MGTGLSRCVDGEKRESPRASSGQLEDNSSEEPGRSNQGLETDSNAEG